MIRTVSVAVLQKAVAADRLYRYRVPADRAASAVPGVCVAVPFGKGDRLMPGVVLETGTAEDAEAAGLKSVLSVADPPPVFNAEMLDLIRYLREYTYCTYYSAIRQLLPPGGDFSVRETFAPNPAARAPLFADERAAAVLRCFRAGGALGAAQIARRTGVRNVSDLLRELCASGVLVRGAAVRRAKSRSVVQAVRLSPHPAGRRLTAGQRAVTDALENGPLSVKELCYRTGVGASVVTNLVKRGDLIAEDLPDDPALYRFGATLPSAPPPLELTAEQQAAYERLLRDYECDGSRTALLFGVTGSGKTRVYLKLIDRCLADGKNVLVLVPEIALTPQTLNIFGGRYGGAVAVFHSAMSAARRQEEWRRVRDRRARIAVGTRSAVFAPMPDIGLIVLDEEQESCYKSEHAPRFHAADVAKFRARRHGALLLLCSATPSVETYARAKSGEYGLAVLSNRYGKSVLPEVIPVDMRKETAAGNPSVFSGLLEREIRDALARGKQIILLLNRRGHNTFVSCPACGHVMTCDRCSISLTYHSANGRLICHYCGKSVPAPSECPVCGNSRLHYSGYGTQKAEAELRTLFPSAGVLRMDTDTMATRTAYEDHIRAFSEGSYDILLGTQMVAKGLDFPNVVLVGVLNADAALYTPDFRGFERAFALLTQVVGRSGRGADAGKAVIQTADPDNGLIRLAERQDYEGFYEEEILTRKLMIYPPFCALTVAYVRSARREQAESGADFLARYIGDSLKGAFREVKLIMLGPVVCGVPKVNNEYRFRLIFKHGNNARTRQLFSAAQAAFSAEKAYKDTALVLDANPQTVQ